MNTIIEEIRKRIEARKSNTNAAGDYDEYADGQGVGLAAALRIIDEVEKEHPVPFDVQEAAYQYAKTNRRICSSKNAGETSRLSPLFTEEMMGFPLGWTELPFLSESGAPNPSKPTETQSCRK